MENAVPIIKNPHKTLRVRAKDVHLSDIPKSKIQKLIAEMKETLKITTDGVGLAASQVNESLRIFIVSEEAEEIDRAEKTGWKRRKQENQGINPIRSKISEISADLTSPNRTSNGMKNEKPYEVREWKYYVFINPVVKNISKRKLDGPEGCLSVPGKFGSVKRYEKITVEAYDENGRKFTRGASRFFARVIQHELDHLNGTLFIDKAEKIFETQKNS